MMKAYFIIVSSVMVMMSAIAQDVRDSGWEFHRKVLKDGFDTSYWKESWKDGLWHIRSVFVDMDGDGSEEMIAITTSEEQQHLQDTQ